MRCVNFAKIFYPETRALKDCRPLLELVCDCVHACRVFYNKFLTRYLTNCSRKLHQIYNFDAFGHKDELISF